MSLERPRQRGEMGSSNIMRENKMTADATREEVINWAFMHRCDFVKQKPAPPKGWVWLPFDDKGTSFVLTGILTNTAAKDVTAVDMVRAYIDSFKLLTEK